MTTTLVYVLRVKLRTFMDAREALYPLSHTSNPILFFSHGQSGFIREIRDYIRLWSKHLAFLLAKGGHIIAVAWLHCTQLAWSLFCLFSHFCLSKLVPGNHGLTFRMWSITSSMVRASTQHCMPGRRKTMFWGNVLQWDHMVFDPGKGLLTRHLEGM